MLKTPDYLLSSSKKVNNFRSNSTSVNFSSSESKPIRTFNFNQQNNSNQIPIGNSMENLINNGNTNLNYNSNFANNNIINKYYNSPESRGK